MTQQAKPVRDRMSALDKALAVLEAITDQPQAVGLPDLTARLGLPRQTVHRILLQLEDNGLILRDPTRDRFSIGPRLTRLSLSALSSSNQSAPLRAILSRLVDDVQESSNVGVLDGMEFVYLERIECHWSLRVHLQAGSRVPAYCTSGGKVLLAHTPDDVRRRLLRAGTRVAHTAHTLTDFEDLEAEFTSIRAQGYALNNQENTVGIIGVAVPIVSANGRALGALALHGPEPRFPLSKAKSEVARLKTAAAALAKVWGLADDEDAAGPARQLRGEGHETTADQDADVRPK